MTRLSYVTESTAEKSPKTAYKVCRCPLYCVISKHVVTWEELGMGMFSLEQPPGRTKPRKEAWAV